MSTNSAEVTIPLPPLAIFEPCFKFGDCLLIFSSLSAACGIIPITFKHPGQLVATDPEIIQACVEGIPREFRIAYLLIDFFIPLRWSIIGPIEIIYDFNTIMWIHS